MTEKIRRYLEVVSGAGLKLAFEIAPFSVIGGIRRFLDICDQIGSPDLGLNFDTGHAWACRELVPLLPFELQGRIFGTHLGDNRSTENVKMPLGQGTVPWAPLLQEPAGRRVSWQPGHRDRSVPRTKSNNGTARVCSTSDRWSQRLDKENRA